MKNIDRPPQAANVDRQAQHDAERIQAVRDKFPNAPEGYPEFQYGLTKKVFEALEPYLTDYDEHLQKVPPKKFLPGLEGKVLGERDITRDLFETVAKRLFEHPDVQRNLEAVKPELIVTTVAQVLRESTW